MNRKPPTLVMLDEATEFPDADEIIRALERASVSCMVVTADKAAVSIRPPDLLPMISTHEFGALPALPERSFYSFRDLSRYARKRQRRKSRGK